MGNGFCHPPGTRNTALPAVVEIVIVEVAGFKPGVTLGELNEQEVRAGRFAQESDTGSLNAPP